MKIIREIKKTARITIEKKNLNRYYQQIINRYF